ncbi:hypothetical protein SAMN02949497_3894 [Methylomagnum ishizawai]|uniref:DUF2288 domain-containing protein n=1 Tax=Methylomagnum ishizawai TaxID=1760988 RepID=A0A1Y6D8C4_9GAMM|nr:DUF2288 family protein [Methylomagnum ishizawai]SMF96494.1 hypothetical protein SAMN02949497_3894 [Methylomagnum ishizawai]
MDYTELQNKLAVEADLIPWRELQRHFARGVLVAVAPGLDLVEVAARVAADDAGVLRGWMEAGRVVRATDEHARRWEAAGQTLRAVVVAPWVLAQEAGRH